MKAYCINLDNRTDKWIEFQKEIIPFPVERFSAIYHNNGSYGCILSHLEVMDKCIDEILIMEDDFHLINEWEYFYKAYSQLPDDWDCLYLGANLHTPLKRYSDNLYRITKGWSNHGILFKRKLVDRILNDGFEVISTHHNIDTYMAHLIQDNYNCFIIYPLLSIQKDGYSDIIKGDRSYNMITNYIKNT